MTKPVDKSGKSGEMSPRPHPKPGAHLFDRNTKHLINDS
jgi:hypothetical protein